jgi:hypothetical protein
MLRSNDPDVIAVTVMSTMLRKTAANSREA